MKLATILCYGLATAISTTSHHYPNDDAKRRLLIGALGKVIIADFDGSAFSVASSTSLEHAVFSWLVFREDSNVIYAVNEMSDELYIYDYDPDGTKDNMISPRDTQAGARSVVHLELNEDGTRMLASAYGSSTVQVWDTSTAKSISLLGDLTKERSGNSKPHQSVRHPTKPFFVVNDLGENAILVVNAQDDDNYSIINTIVVESGCGPRHGVFVKETSIEHPTHYTVVCEKSNKLLAYKLGYDRENTIEFDLVDDIPTAEPGSLGPDAAAGEIIIINNDIYVSNRNTGKSEDSISHFKISDGKPKFDTTFSSGADNPRMMSVSKDGKFIYVANMDNPKGLHAFRRDSRDGTIQDGTAMFADLTGELEAGPQFVLEMSAT